MLTIELVPQSCFFSNLRNAVEKSDWDRLRHEVYAKTANKCTICGGRGPRWPLECHETWEYDDIHGIQKLVGLVGLCPACHEVKHFGRAQTIGREAEALAHLMKVNGWDERQAGRHISDSFEVWSRRSEEDWKQDLSWASGKIRKWKDHATRNRAIAAGFEEIAKGKRDRAVAEELMED